MTVSAASYARISVSDERTPKCADQHAANRKLAKQRGYVIVAEYTDDGIKASKGTEPRDGFASMLSDLDAGRFTVILATEPERLARNMPETITLGTACIKAGAIWETGRSGVVDYGTAQGKFNAELGAALGGMESARKAERQKAANAARRERGERTPGPRAFGWADDRVSLNKREAALIRKGTAMVLAGARPFEVLRVFRDSGIPTARGQQWTSVRVQNTLRRLSNAGVIEHDGVPLEGTAKWDTIVSRQEVEDVRAILSGGGRPAGQWKTATRLGSGLINCQCGSPMVTTGRGNGKVSYRCSAIVNKGSMKKPGIHCTIDAGLVDERLRLIVCELYMLDAESMDSTAEELATLYRALTEATEAIERLTASVAAGTLTDAEAARQLMKLRRQRDETQARINESAQRSAHALMISEARSRLAENVDWNATETKQALLDAFDMLPLDDQRKLVKALLQVTIYPGRGVERIDIH